MLSLLAILSLSSPTLANEIPCANMAKYAAIRAYKAEIGEVQGSDGMEYSAVPSSIRGDKIAYLVSISENNEDGDQWTLRYNVVLSWKLDRKPACQVLSVNKVAND